jgi:pimeloyl-ACP methyl ester carboxylesterase
MGGEALIVARNVLPTSSGYKPFRPLNQTLGTITCPTLVLVGDEDTLTPPELSQVIADGIAGATLVRIPRAGHLANVEQSQAFSSALAAFLERLDS